MLSPCYDGWEIPGGNFSECARAGLELLWSNSQHILRLWVGSVLQDLAALFPWNLFENIVWTTKYSDCLKILDKNTKNIDMKQRCSNARHSKIYIRYYCLNLHSFKIRILHLYEHDVRSYSCNVALNTQRKINAMYYYHDVILGINKIFKFSWL